MPTGLPWDDPNSDPVGDMVEYVELARAEPWQPHNWDTAIGRMIISWDASLQAIHELDLVELGGRVTAMRRAEDAIGIGAQYWLLVRDDDLEFPDDDPEWAL